MKFEDTIKKISGFVAGLLIFFIGAGMYLNLKGFIMSPDGRPVLVKEARAAANPKEADDLAQKIAANVNVILPRDTLSAAKTRRFQFTNIPLSAAITAPIFISKPCPNFKKTLLTAARSNSSSSTSRSTANQ